MSNAKDELLAAQRTWMRWCLLVWATVVAYATFRAGVIKPPGGFWRHDKAGPDGHQAGQPVMVNKFPASYAWFITFNSMAFFTSVIILVLFSSERILRTSAMRTTMLLIALLNMACFVGAFIFGSIPEYPPGALLAIAVVCVLILTVAYIASNLPWRNQHSEA